jgi:hypothetical protein
MQLIDRLLLRLRKQNDNDTIASTTSTVKNNLSSKRKKFSLKQFYWSNKRQQSVQNKDEAIEIEKNQELLTQCIEAALLPNNNNSNTILQPRSTTTNTNNYRRNKRWSMVDTTSISFNDIQPQKLQSRQRKLSLPPQYSNIGYLASIPEVDSFTSNTIQVV